MGWKHLPASITGTVDQELLLRNEYLVTENRLLRHQIKTRLRLSDGERKTLTEIGKKLSRLCRKFGSGGYEGAVGPVCVEIKQPGSRTVRPQ